MATASQDLRAPTPSAPLKRDMRPEAIRIHYDPANNRERYLHLARWDADPDQSQHKDFIDVDFATLGVVPPTDTLLLDHSTGTVLCYWGSPLEAEVVDKVRQDLMKCISSLRYREVGIKTIDVFPTIANRGYWRNSDVPPQDIGPSTEPAELGKRARAAPDEEGSDSDRASKQMRVEAGDAPHAVSEASTSHASTASEGSATTAAAAAYGNTPNARCASNPSVGGLPPVPASSTPHSTRAAGRAAVVRMTAESVVLRAELREAKRMLAAKRAEHLRVQSALRSAQERQKELESAIRTLLRMFAEMDSHKRNEGTA